MPVVNRVGKIDPICRRREDDITVKITNREFTITRRSISVFEKPVGVVLLE